MQPDAWPEKGKNKMMVAHTIVNSLGLLCDIAGAILIFRYGLPEPVNKAGNSWMLLEETDLTEIAKARRYDRLARLGLFLLLFGFAGQLVSNLI